MSGVEEENTIIDKVIWGATGEFGFVNIILAGFFLAWNSMCGSIIIVPCVRGIFFGCRAFWKSTNPILLIFPHWYLGIGVPCYMGGLFSGSVAVLVPYSYLIFTNVNMALQEKSLSSATEATRVKYDVLDVLKKIRHQVDEADHADDVKTALETLMQDLAKVKQEDGTPILPDLAFIKSGVTKPAEVVKSDADPAESNEVVESNENNTLSRNVSNVSAFSALTRTISGKQHYQTGIKKDDRIPIVQATVVGR
mmetsp:Transcript_130210/g.230096  ORF Transcript_130210/g.230096 Transcript_130210/m.230096 type:complete len:252 (-) Transcript_130210:41-796(-)